MAHDDRRAIVRAYDRIAGQYLDRFGAPPPGTGDQEFIARSLALMGAGPVLDVGCGPGQLTRQATEAGCRAIGADLTPAMLAQAVRHAPEARFVTADARALPLRNAACTGVLACYVAHHFPRAQAGAIFAELHRVLLPGGRLVLTAHLGDGDRWHGDEPDQVRVTLYARPELPGLIRQAGFDVESFSWRDPAPDEFPAEHGFLRARAR
jgi:ubiquinone/menaquinone biosynthesis C-methylase UbiE